MDTRSIDVAKTASIDMMNLNKKVVKMRPIVKRSKAQIVNRLCRHISSLKKKKGTEAQKEKNIRKAERLIEEIESIRRLKEDKVSKYSLANTTTFESISKSTLSPNMRALARLADHHLVKEAVNDFRQKHSDWRDLAAFLLVKQTGRKFKTKKQKQKKLAHRVENINASETMTKAYIEERFGKEGLEKAEQRFQKKRKKGVKVDAKETHLSEIEKEQDIDASHDSEAKQTENIISPDDKTEEAVSERENQIEDLTSLKKMADENIIKDEKANVVKNKKQTITSTDSKNTLIAGSTDTEEITQDSRSELGKSENKGDSEGDDSADGETEEENDESNKEEDGESVEEDQASRESEDIADADDSNQTEESDVSEERDESDESGEEESPKKDASTTSTKSKIPIGEKSMKSGECVVKKLKIGASSDDDEEEEGDDDEISEEDSDDTSMEDKSNSVSSKSVSSEQDDDEDFESQQPHKKRKAHKEGKSKKNKLVPEFLTKRDQVLKNTPNDPFFVGSDGEEGDDDGDVMRHTQMDFDANNDYFDDRGSGSGARTSRSMFYEPGEVNLSGRRFEKKDFSSGFKSRGRGRFEYRGHGRSFERSRGDFRGRGRRGYHESSNRGRGREARDDGERKVFKFGSGKSRGEERGAFSSRGSTQRGRGDKQMSFQRFGSSTSKDSGPVSTSADKLHPSWEASRKRKAEQSGLKAFEGTKIVFDDD